LDFTELNRALTAAGLNILDATDVAVEDGYALYATDSTYGMSVLAEADPTKPYKLGSTATSGSALGVDNATILGVKYALVADGGKGLSVISTQRRSQPVQKGVFDTPGWASDVAAATLGGKSYACIADGGSGLRIVNLSPERAIDSTIFSDDFEDEFAGWQQTGTVEWYTLEPKNGTHAVRLRTDASIQQAISTLGFEDITVSFSLGVSGLDTGSEYVLAQWYDGQDWNSLTEIRAGDQLENRLYQFASSLGADADDNPDFILRFEIHCSGPADSAYVDDVLVKAPPPKPTGSLLIVK